LTRTDKINKQTKQQQQQTNKTERKRTRIQNHEVDQDKGKFIETRSDINTKM